MLQKVLHAVLVILLFIGGCGEKYIGPAADLVIKNAKIVTLGAPTGSIR